MHSEPIWVQKGETEREWVEMGNGKSFYKTPVKHTCWVNYMYIKMNIYINTFQNTEKYLTLQQHKLFLKTSFHGLLIFLAGGCQYFVSEEI